ncbi:MAG: HNH endonuclease signature motif containing protein [Pseudomonadota bacterium]
MVRRSQRRDPEKLRKELVDLLEDFESRLREDDLRDKVRALIPANYTLRDLGSSLIESDDASSARDRILAYFRKFPRTLIHGDELMVVAGISEYARRIRELRVEFGWPIFGGKSLIDLLDEDDQDSLGFDRDLLKPDDYFLLEDTQDRDAAFRWKLANDIRKSPLSVKDKILDFLRRNVGQRVTGEELKYLAKDKSEWARRVRELRTEDGWPVMTRVSGVRELPVGVYILEQDRQAPKHDRNIPDPVRVEVLERDGFACRICGWSRSNANPDDRTRNLLELHHIDQHAHGGENVAENLITLCNVHHDEVHRGGIGAEELQSLVVAKT